MATYQHPFGLLPGRQASRLVVLQDSVHAAGLALMMAQTILLQLKPRPPYGTGMKVSSIASVGSPSCATTDTLEL